MRGVPYNDEKWNLHRSPFAGRIYEYCSVDPVLTGDLAAAVTSGAGDAGMFCHIRHFAVNEQETNVVPRKNPFPLECMSDFL